MAKAGAPEGNQNAKKGREWTAAIRNALAHYSGEGATEGMNKIARKLVDAAENGDSWALKELGDRVEGKPSQIIEASVDSTVHVSISPDDAETL